MDEMMQTYLQLERSFPAASLGYLGPLALRAAGSEMSEPEGGGEHVHPGR